MSRVDVHRLFSVRHHSVNRTPVYPTNKYFKFISMYTWFITSIRSPTLIGLVSWAIAALYYSLSFRNWTSRHFCRVREEWKQSHQVVVGSWDLRCHKQFMKNINFSLDNLQITRLMCNSYFQCFIRLCPKLIINLIRPRTWRIHACWTRLRHKIQNPEFKPNLNRKFDLLSDPKCKNIWMDFVGCYKLNISEPERITQKIWN